MMTKLLVGRKEDKKMSREEILKQIEDIEKREFFLQMKDRWSQEDYKLSDKHHEEIRELKKKLEEL